MAPPGFLLGPPAARNPTPAMVLGPVPPAVATPAALPQAPTGDPFIDLLDASFNAAAKPPMGLTENMSATYLSSGNPCLDFFFQIVPSTPSATVAKLLNDAWQQDPLTALKLVCHLRGVRGTGKSDKEGFYASALWLHEYHPKTLALNVGSFAEFGYMKDLLEIIHRLLDGPDTRKIAKSKHKKSKILVGRNRRIARTRYGDEKKKKIGTPDERIAAELAKVEKDMDEASKKRFEKKKELAIRAVERYARDPAYRFLYDRVAEFFAELLASDLEQLKAGKLNRIGLAAKWCPSLDASFDRSTLLCESIARWMFPKDSNPEYSEIEEQHYAYRVRDRLRKEVLVPLRKVLELPEVYMSARQWDALPYNRVASVAMKKYKEIFMKHDKDRFSEYLQKVKEGKAKIAAGALLPHEIVAECREKEDEVAELQWQRMVQDLLKLGKLSNCIAVCDVSGSMTGIPMQVSVALGIMISELSEEPWKGRLITFSQNPELHKVSGETLREKAEFVEQMDWGGNTDFQKVFDKILQVAVEGKLPSEKMIKRIFVFSDMEFDQASANVWETDYEVICRKYRANGYGEAIPEIVFWNLRDSRSTPVPSNQKGVALVSGFSKNLVKLFLEEGGIIDPLAAMEAAIAGAEYQKLVVFD